MDALQYSSTRKDPRTHPEEHLHVRIVLDLDIGKADDADFF